MEQILINIEMSGDYYHHVGLKEGKLIVIDNDLEGDNCRIIRSPFEKIEEETYFDFIISGDYDLMYCCSTLEDFDIDTEELENKKDVEELMHKVFEKAEKDGVL